MKRSQDIFVYLSRNETLRITFQQRFHKELCGMGFYGLRDEKSQSLSIITSVEELVDGNEFLNILLWR